MIELKFIGKDVGDVHQQLLAYAQATGGAVVADIVASKPVEQAAPVETSKPAEDAPEDKPRRTRTPKAETKPEPKEDDEPEVTIEQIREAAALVPADKEDDAVALLDTFKCEKLSGLMKRPNEDRLAFIEGCKALCAPKKRSLADD